jgi:hypothetical protein
LSPRSEAQIPFTLYGGKRGKNVSQKMKKFKIHPLRSAEWLDGAATSESSPAGLEALRQGRRRIEDQ